MRAAIVAILALFVVACGEPPMSDVSSWDPTAGNNTSTPPDGAPEGMAPSTVNDTMREMMAAVKREQIDSDIARVYSWQVADGGATASPTITAVGPALTTLGNSATGSFGLVTRETDSTTDTDAGWYLDDGDLYTGQNSVNSRITFSGRVAVPSDITDVRIYFGLYSASPLAYTDLASNAISGAGIRYATDADGTAYWRTITSNGSSQTVTTTTSGIAASSYYDLRVEMESGSAKFYVNGTLTATHTTHVPWPSGGAGGPFPFLGIRTLDAGPTTISRQITFIRLHTRID